jgi:hypothetical protein
MHLQRPWGSCQYPRPAYSLGGGVSRLQTIQRGVMRRSVDMVLQHNLMFNVLFRLSPGFRIRFVKRKTGPKAGWRIYCIYRNRDRANHLQSRTEA